MKKTWKSSVLVLLLSLISGHGAEYSVIDLGLITDLAGRAESGPKGINTWGSACGVNLVNASYRALLYAGAWTNLGTLGGFESLAAGINDSGQVVGYSSTLAGDTHGFIWTPGGTGGVPGNPQMRDLPGLIPGVSQAYAANNQGQVTGYSDFLDNSKSVQRAVVWWNGTVTDIGALLGKNLPNSFGYGINEAGHIAGTAYNASYSSASAFLYDGTSATNIAGLGGSDASALAINDAHQITGYAKTIDGLDHAFRFEAGLVQDLGTLGGHYSYGLGINNRGVIVGGSFTDVNDSVYHAFVWSNNVMQDLNALLDSTGLGWVVVEARALNDWGYIAGSGKYLGANHAFLLKPIQAPAGPLITSVKVSEGSVVLQFTTVPGAIYCVQSTAVLKRNAWSNVMTGIPGTGACVEVTITVPVALCQFLRINRSF